MAYSLGMATAMKIYNTTLNAIPFPGCEDQELLSDEYWECQVITSTPPSSKLQTKLSQLPLSKPNRVDSICTLKLVRRKKLNSVYILFLFFRIGA